MQKNPYEALYNQSIFIKANMSNSEYTLVAQHLGLMHNALGKAILDVINVLGVAVAQNNSLKQEYHRTVENMQISKPSLGKKERLQIQEKIDKRLKISQLQQFQFRNNLQNTQQNRSLVISNTKTRSLQSKSSNQNQISSTQQFDFNSCEKIRIGEKLNQNKSFQQLFKEPQNNKAQELERMLKKGFDVYDFLYKSQNSDKSSDIEESFQKQKSHIVKSSNKISRQNSLVSKYASTKLQKMQIQSSRSLHDQKRTNQNQQNTNIQHYDDSNRNKMVNINYEPYTFNSNSNSNSNNFNLRNHKVSDLPVKRAQREDLIKRAQREDLIQKIIRQQKLKNFDPNATSRYYGNKKQRQLMKGIQCQNCTDYYQILGFQRTDLCQCTSRHRSNASSTFRRRHNDK